MIIAILGFIAGAVFVVLVGAILISALVVQLLEDREEGRL